MAHLLELSCSSKLINWEEVSDWLFLSIFAATHVESSVDLEGSWPIGKRSLQLNPVLLPSSEIEPQSSFSKQNLLFHFLVSNLHQVDYCWKYLVWVENQDLVSIGRSFWFESFDFFFNLSQFHNSLALFADICFSSFPDVSLLLQLIWNHLNLALLMTLRICLHLLLNSLHYSVHNLVERVSEFAESFERQGLFFGVFSVRRS